MKLKSIKTISILGTHEGVGRGMVSLNIAAEMTKRNMSVAYGSSIGNTQNKNILLNGLRDNDKEKGDLYLRPTRIEGLKLLSYSKNADKMSPKKIEELLVDMPKKLKEECEYLVYNIRDPFSFPDRYILLHTDIYIVVAKIESSVFSDIFQQLEKLAFMPTKPQHMYIAFNYTRDIDRAFETYLQIVKQAGEFGINVQFYFLGTIPDDSMRQVIANKTGKPLTLAFPESSLHGAISFITDKIIGQPESVENPDNLPVSV
jgi:MinD-like ATPase involved in chromosome partitioning or flagellar assembly